MASNVVNYQARAKAKKPKKGGKKVFWLLILFASLGLVLTYLASPLALIDKIEVIGNNQIIEADILTAAQLEPGMHIWRADIREASNRVRAHPMISKASIDRVFPNHLSISVQEHHGIAILKGPKDWVVAEDGSALVERSGQSLPWITGWMDEEIIAGTSVEGQALDLALKWINILQPIEPQISELNLTHYPTYVGVYTTDGYKLLFDPFDDLEARISDVLALMQQVRSSNLEGTLDFRAGNGRGVFHPWVAEEVNEDEQIGGEEQDQHSQQSDSE